MRTFVNEHSKIYLSSSSSLPLFIVNGQSGSVIDSRYLEWLGGPMGTTFHLR